MPKKVLFESAVHHLAMAGKRLLSTVGPSGDEQFSEVKRFIDSWRFAHEGKSRMLLAWSVPSEGAMHVDFHDAHFYTRGDTSDTVERQRKSGLVFSEDSVKIGNEGFFDKVLQEALSRAGVRVRGGDK